MKREKVALSTLGNYFGYGFSTAREQFLTDLGLIEEREFTLAEEHNLNKGIFLEEPMLDYWQHRLINENVINGDGIFDRNTTVRETDVARFKWDGSCFYRGKLCLVENKISSVDFTANKGYHIYCQAVIMEAKKLGFDFSGALLVGLEAGKPKGVFIAPDRRLQAEIADMLAWITKGYQTITSIKDAEEYLKWIPTKRSVDVEHDAIVLSAQHLTCAKEYAQINAQIAELNRRKEALGEELKALDEGSYDNGELKITVSRVERRGSFDFATFQMEHPDIDVAPYMSEGSVSKTLRVTMKKKKG